MLKRKLHSSLPFLWMGRWQNGYLQEAKVISYSMAWFGFWCRNLFVCKIKNYSSIFYSRLAWSGWSNILIRANTILISKSLPRWFIYSLPDDLWVLSNTCINIIIWRCQINRRNILWYLSIPTIGISSEFLQFFGFFPGIFDINDILAYCAGFVVPAFAFKLKWSE